MEDFGVLELMGKLDAGMLNAEPESSVSERALQISRKYLKDLSSGEIAFCLRQKLAITHTFPLALVMLEEDPLQQAELYHGDLLSAALYASDGLLEDGSEWYTRLWDVCAQALAEIDTLQKVVPEITGCFPALANEP